MAEDRIACYRQAGDTAVIYSSALHAGLLNRAQPVKSFEVDVVREGALR